jgi:hypothetical protein
MAIENEKVKGTPPTPEKTIQVSEKSLLAMQEKMAELERQREEDRSKMAGLEELFSKSASAQGENKLREKKNFEPAFRTVRIRKYPIAGDFDNLGYVIGWDKRGAYQEVDRTGVTPQVIDFINIFFLGKERNAQGKLSAEKVRLLDLMNNGIQVHCKVIDTKRVENKVPTGEEIDVSVFDPQHGLVATGDKIDGYFTQSDIDYTISIPGIEKPVEIGSEFVN